MFPGAPKAVAAINTFAALVRYDNRGLARECTLSVDRIGKKLGRVTPEDLDRLVEGLNEIVRS